MTTQEVALKLGVSKLDILVAVNYQPHLRPEKRYGRSYLWNKEEVQALQTYLTVSKRKRLAKP